MLTSEYTRRISSGREPDLDRIKLRAKRAAIATLVEAKRSNPKRRIVYPRALA